MMFGYLSKLYIMETIKMLIEIHMNGPLLYWMEGLPSQALKNLCVKFKGGEGD
jgi:hypothetical protein